MDFFKTLIHEIQRGHHSTKHQRWLVKVLRKMQGWERPQSNTCSHFHLHWNSSAHTSYTHVWLTPIMQTVKNWFEEISPTDRSPTIEVGNRRLNYDRFSLCLNCMSEMHMNCISESLWKLNCEIDWFGTVKSDKEFTNSLFVDYQKIDRFFKCFLPRAKPTSTCLTHCTWKIDKLDLQIVCMVRKWFHDYPLNFFAIFLFLKTISSTSSIVYVASGGRSRVLSTTKVEC